MKVNVKQVKARVKRGDQFMLKYDPKYWEKIDEANLNMINAGRCIWGQVFGSYRDGMQEFGIKRDWIDPSTPREVSLGMYEPKNASDDYYDILTDEWKKIIRYHKQRHSQGGESSND